MTTLATLTWQAAIAGRWIARIAGTLMVLFLLTFLIGEGPPPVWRFTPREQLFGLGMLALFGGLAVAWFREGAGGLLSVAGWIFLAMVARRPAWDLPFLIPMIAGAMHVVCWIRLRGPAPAIEPLAPEAAFRLKLLWTGGWVLLAIFVLLSANEIFGQPPMMTAKAPPDGLAGTWSATLTTVSRQAAIPVVLAIHPDGTVSGSIGGAAVVRARMTGNRSWFGRLMHWRTDYSIRGELAHPVDSGSDSAGDRFSVLLDAGAADLAGSLVLSHPGAPKALGVRLRKQ